MKLTYLVTICRWGGRNTTLIKIERKKEVNDIVPPTIYNGKEISGAASRKLLQSKGGRRKQIHGLVYAPKMMPSLRKNHGWDFVFRRPSWRGSVNKLNALSYDILTPEGYIHVRFPRTYATYKIKTATNHFLLNHTHVRNEMAGESGVMACAGLRVDLVSASKCHYIDANNNSFPDKNTRILKESAIEFHQFLKSNVAEKEINALRKKNNLLNSAGEKIHPTYIFSKDLTNSIHVDTGDDSRSFASFFWQEVEGEKNGLTWFLFPFYGIAIECSQHTLISWDGRVMFYCSCTVHNGLYSFFTTSKLTVARHTKVELALRRKKELTIKLQRSNICLVSPNDKDIIG